MRSAVIVCDDNHDVLSIDAGRGGQFEHNAVLHSFPAFPPASLPLSFFSVSGDQILLAFEWNHSSFPAGNASIHGDILNGTVAKVLRSLNFDYFHVNFSATKVCWHLISKNSSFLASTAQLSGIAFPFGEVADKQQHLSRHVFENFTMDANKSFICASSKTFPLEFFASSSFSGVLKLFNESLRVASTSDIKIDVEQQFNQQEATMTKNNRNSSLSRRGDQRGILSTLTGISSAVLERDVSLLSCSRSEVMFGLGVKSNGSILRLEMGDAQTTVSVQEEAKSNVTVIEVNITNLSLLETGNIFTWLVDALSHQLLLWVNGKFVGRGEIMQTDALLGSSLQDDGMMECRFEGKGIRT